MSVPLWSASIARRDARLRALLLGPGTTVAVHAVALVITLLLALGGQSEGSWLMLYLVMIWGVALAAYVVYCAITFTLITRFSRR